VSWWSWPGATARYSRMKSAPAAATQPNARRQRFGLSLADGKRTLAGSEDHLVRAQAEEYCGKRGSALIVGRIGRSRMSARDGYPRCPERGDSGAAVFALPMCGDPSRRRNYARPMHAGIRVCHRKDGVFASVSPGPDIAVGISAARRRTCGGDNSPADHEGGARLEQQAVASQPPAPAAATHSISLSIDGGHVR
jgi:hypothetical protein